MDLAAVPLEYIGTIGTRLFVHPKFQTAIERQPPMKWWVFAWMTGVLLLGQASVPAAATGQRFESLYGSDGRRLAAAVKWENPGPGSHG